MSIFREVTNNEKAMRSESEWMNYAEMVDFQQDLLFQMWMRIF